ncbi:MAG: DUF2071 domain-containing protein [Bacteroidia bacterium]|nr:DUF2071 domain-containing protein [Bacteroidia bacterium]
MNSAIKELLTHTAHRKFPIPKRKWDYYLEWLNALFIHWKINYDELRKLVPKELEIDLMNGESWVSLVLFDMKNIRPRGIPPLAAVSDFHEINLRTYVTHNGIPGVYFISMEGHKALSVFVTKLLTGFPYIKSDMQFQKGHYNSVNVRNNLKLDIEFEGRQAIEAPLEIAKWLTERYSVYDVKKGKKVRFIVHHKPWPLQQVKLINAQMHYRIGEVELNEHVPDLVHYSDGVKVVAWGKETLKD